MAGIPRLKISAAEAEALLDNQKRRGVSIEQYPLTSVGIAEAEERLHTWERQTEEILAEMFDTTELAEEFKRSASLYDDLGKTDMDKIQMIGGRITYKNYALDDIIKNLSKYAQAPIKQSVDFWDLIHPAITGVARTRFDDGYYADSIETALKHINSLVKAKVKRKTGDELDGAPLMNTAFSVKNPVLCFDDISTETGRNIQQGYMQIFAGAMIGVRNPKAHEIVSIDRERAIHFLFLASLLMHKLDEAS
jgi:uncharacterized protein (TIGR02391 family)